MKTNYHTHTTRCMHATGDDEDYVLSAIKGGYRILGFSDHTPWKYRTDYVADMRMLPEELPGYVESLKTLREKYHDRYRASGKRYLDPCRERSLADPYASLRDSAGDRPHRKRSPHGTASRRRQSCRWLG